MNMLQPPNAQPSENEGTVPQSQWARVLAVIPARYASTRFPGKPLVEIQGKPMIQHVWERVSRTKGIDRAVIATDDDRIAQAAQQFGAEVRMTDPAHPSGTDRVWEVAQACGEYDWVLNVQGDEPFIEPAHLQAILSGIQQYSQADILTLVTPLNPATHDWQDPNIVKAVLAQSGRALYFSRQAIPYYRDQPEQPQNLFRHLGLYLFRLAALQRFTQAEPSPLEQLEKLEQLRALELDMVIYALPVEGAAIGIDTPADLDRLKDFLNTRFP